MPERVLVVDDWADGASSSAKLLMLEGYEAATATDGESGLALALERGFDAILLDLHLPDISGLEVLKQLRIAGVLTPTVLITAFPDLESSFLAGTHGAQGFIDSPLFGDDVVSVVRQAISGPYPVRLPTDSRPREKNPIGTQVTNNRLPAEVREVLGAIRARPHTSVDSLASMLQWSPSRLRHVFRAWTGQSLGSFLREARLGEGARLLRGSTQPVKDIGDALGLDSFRRAFRTRFGMAPRDYRRTFSVARPTRNDRK